MLFLRTISMKKLVLLAFSLVFPSALFAVPRLQLDVLGGTYVGGGDETVYATNDPFVLVALLDPTTNVPVGENFDKFYISAAIVPKVGETSGGAPTADFGSFSINGTTYSYTGAASNMQYGGPPVDNSNLFPTLPTHGIYATWFAEVQFYFGANDRAVVYNSMDDPGGLQTAANGGLLYHSFLVDTSGLNAGFAVHFDLYDEIIQQKKNSTNYSLHFAPFSHDAQGETHAHEVPETVYNLGLLSAAVALLGALRRRCSGR